MDSVYNQIITKIAAIYDNYEEQANQRSEDQRKKLGTQIDKKQKEFLDQLNKIQEKMMVQLKDIENSRHLSKNNRDCPRMIRQCLKDIQSITRKKALMFKVNNHLQTLAHDTEQQVRILNKQLPNSGESGGFSCFGGGDKSEKYKTILTSFQNSASQWNMLAQLEPKDSVENFVAPKFSIQQFSFLKKVLKEKWPQPKQPQIKIKQVVKQVVKQVQVVKEVPVGAMPVASKVSLANQYLFGINREENPSYGLKIYHEEAEKSDPSACSFLGQVYEEGLFLPQNLNKAMEYYNRAIRKNSSFAKYRYALATMKGKLNQKGMSKGEFEKGIKLLIQASEGGDPCSEALVELGSFYQRGKFSWDIDSLFITTTDLKKAVDLYKKARHLHSAKASNNLGVLYFQNRRMDEKNFEVKNQSNIKENMEKAKKYLEEAEEQGFSQAFFNLGCVYQKGFMGIKNEEKALRYYYEGGLKGDVQSKLKFSYLLMKQVNVKGNQYDDYYKLSQKWLDGIIMKTSLVEENEGRLGELHLQQKAEAMFYLGLVHEYGFGVEKNPKTAYSYFLQSSDMQYPPAKNKVGDCYFSGYGVKKDRQTAIGLYVEAAEVLNNPEAMVNLGTIYLNGLPELVQRNYNKAYEYFTKAMDYENTDAFIHLSYMYKTGLGFDRDEEMAKKLLEQAAQCKNSTALYMLKEMGGSFDQRVLFQKEGDQASPKKINLKQIVPVIFKMGSK